MRVTKNMGMCGIEGARNSALKHGYGLQLNICRRPKENRGAKNVASQWVSSVVVDHRILRTSWARREPIEMWFSSLLRAPHLEVGQLHILR